MKNHVLIFDFGNVVAFFEYLKAFQRFGARMDISGELFRQRVVDGGFSSFLGRLESGEIAPEQFATAMSAFWGSN